SSNETLKNIWLWHAIEESEHKSVAFDLYQDASGNNFIRLVVMPFVTLYMAGIMTAGTVYLGITHFSVWKLLHLKEFNTLILGKNGFLSTLWKDYL
ncbi:metal-dependent hydrolase, partial [Citrobacter freundii]|uniref:metal-dependent hydrolase n=2 Tax=Gammaproteobacteria TaxID=1236 RepID=UPI0021C8B3B2